MFDFINNTHLSLALSAKEPNRHVPLLEGPLVPNSLSTKRPGTPWLKTESRRECPSIFHPERFCGRVHFLCCPCCMQQAGRVRFIWNHSANAPWGCAGLEASISQCAPGSAEGDDR